MKDLAEYGLIALDEDGFPIKEKQVVCWRVESGEEDETSACWKDKSLFQAFIDYYASTKQEAPVFCIVYDCIGVAVVDKSPDHSKH